MSKEIIVGDIHVDSTSRFEHSKGNYILESCIQVLNYIISYGEEHGIKKYTFLGDIFERKDKIPNRLKNPIIDVFKRLLKCDVIILEGNHDREGQDSTIKFLEPYAEIISEPTIDKFSGKLYIPYNRNVDEIINTIKSYDAYTYNIILGHFEIKGCSYGGIKKSDNGIPLNIFADKTVIAGHIHKFQEVGNGVYHLGSIYQVDWGEQNEKKYFCVIDGEDISFKKLPTMVNRITLEYGDESVEDKIIVGSFNIARIVYESRVVDVKDVITYKDKLIKIGFSDVSLEPFSTQMAKSDKGDLKNINSVYSQFIKESLEEVKNISQRVLYRNIINKVMEVE